MTAHAHITQDVTPVLVRVKTVARMFDVTPQTIWNRVRSGAFPEPFKWEGATVWKVSELDAYADSLGDTVGDKKP